MKSLSAELLAAQKQGQVRPAVRLMVRDRQGADLRLNWLSLYSGMEPDGPNACVQASDGSLVRARVDPGTNKLWIGRVTDPTQSGQWTAWTDSGDTAYVGQVALAAQPSGPKVFLFFVATSGFILYMRESTDYGATFGAKVQVVSEGSGIIASVAAAIQSNGEPIAFYSHDPAGSGSDAVVKVVKRASGTWGSPAAWPHGGKFQFKGLACSYQGDFNLLAAGRDSATGNPWRLWSVIYGDGFKVGAGSWSALSEVEIADPNLQFQYSYPTLIFLDVFRAAYVGSYTGSGGYNRLYHLRIPQGGDFIDGNWTDPAPANISTAYGASLAYDSPSAYIYLVGANFAYRASASGAAAVDLSARLVAYRAVDRYGEDAATIELDNADGALNNIGQAGNAYEAVHRGALVELSPGYEASAGKQYRQRPSLWIESHRHLTTEGTARLVLECVGGWGMLAGWRASRQYVWAGGSKNVFGIASRILAFAGLELFSTGESSAELANFYPAFTIPPGMEGKTALLRLMDKIPDLIFWDLSAAYAKQLSASEAADYSYGGTGDHIILRGEYDTSTPVQNHAEVFGAAGSFGEALDYGEIALVGHRLAKVTDYTYDTNAESGSRASAELRQAQARASRGRITVFPNVGQELFDVVSITDSQVPTPSGRRVVGIIEEYDSLRGMYLQILELGDR